jgi:cellulose synthase operon protein C
MSASGDANDAVRALFQEENSSENFSSIETEFRQAAALLATFDPDLLKTKEGHGPPDAEVLQSLLRDSEVRRSSSGRSRWHLKPDARKRALWTFATRAEMQNTLLQNERPTGDPIQDAINAAVLDEKIRTESQSSSQLTASLQVVNWLQNVPKDEPLQLASADLLQADSELLELKAPLQRLAGQHFVGRKSELRQLTDFASSVNAAPIFAVWGVGGVGKSALLAKYLLDAMEAQDNVGVLGVYIDFDRPTIRVDEPASVIVDAMRQLRSQLQTPNNFSTAVIDAFRNDLNQWLGSNRDGSAGFGNFLNSTYGYKFFQKTTGMVREAANNRSIVFVLDSFEEVQYRSREFTNAWIEFFSQLRKMLPTSRAIAGSRTALLEPSAANQLELRALDAEAATACLVALGVSQNTAKALASVIGGNPLSLRLAAQLLHQENKLNSGDGIIHDKEFIDLLRNEFVQGTLLRRILGHIHDDDVRRLAHPGMILRRLTPDVLLHVLAKPCRVTIKSKRRAYELFNELAMETALVETGADADELRHRPDVREQMLKLIIESEPTRVLQVHRAAVRYYSKKKGATARAEELYHRLSLNQKRHTLDRRWSPEAEALLRRSIDELPHAARIYVASKSSVGLEAVLPTPSATDQLWQSANLIEWERHAARRIRDLLNLRHFPEALRVAQERTLRSKESPLFLSEARILKWLGRWVEAKEVLAKGIKLNESGKNVRLLLELTLYQLRIAMHLGDDNLTKECYDRAQRLSGRTKPHDIQMQLVLAELTAPVLAIPREEAKHKAKSLLLKHIRRVRGYRKMINRVCAELVDSDLDIVLRVLRINGLTQPSFSAIRDLGDSLKEWDDSMTPLEKASPLRVAAGLSNRVDGSLWNDLVARKSAHRDAVWLIKLLKVNVVPTAVRKALANLLRGVDELSELQQGEEASGRALYDRTEMMLSLNECMARVLPSAIELDAFMATWIGSESVSVSPRSLPHSARITEYLKWIDSSNIVPKLLAALRQLWPADDQINDFCRHIGNGSNSEQEVRGNIREWARGYERLRSEHESSDQRTQLMTGLVEILLKMISERSECPDAFHLSESAGERLAAVVALRKNIDTRYIRWLSERVTVERPFVGYNAALALLKCAEQKERVAITSIVNAVNDALERLALNMERDTDRERVLMSAKQRLSHL